MRINTPESPHREGEPRKKSGKESAPRAGSVPLPGRLLRAASSGLPPPVPLRHTQLSTFPSPVRSQEHTPLLSHRISIERTRKILWRSLPALLARYPELLQYGRAQELPQPSHRRDFIPCGTSSLTRWPHHAQCGGVFELKVKSAAPRGWEEGRA